MEITVSSVLEAVSNFGRDFAESLSSLDTPDAVTQSKINYKSK